MTDTPEYVTTLERYSATFDDTRFVRLAMIDTLVALREGKIGATEANAAARLGEVVVGTLHTQLRVVQEMGLHARLPELPRYADVDAEVVEDDDGE